MKMLISIISLLSFSLVITILNTAYANTLPAHTDMRIKPHHQAVQLICKNCHQLANEGEFKPLKTETCLACHVSAEKVARRTGFMDINHTNPHNSLHDGLDLDCHECHKEHQPSANLCQTCHDNTSDWFKAVP